VIGAGFLTAGGWLAVSHDGWPALACRLRAGSGASCANFAPPDPFLPLGFVALGAVMVAAGVRQWVRPWDGAEPRRGDDG
jgi:hypothetical protein